MIHTILEFLQCLFGMFYIWTKNRLPKLLKPAYFAWNKTNSTYSHLGNKCSSLIGILIAGKTYISFNKTK